MRLCAYTDLGRETRSAVRARSVLYGQLCVGVRRERSDPRVRLDVLVVRLCQVLGLVARGVGRDPHGEQERAWCVRQLVDAKGAHIDNVLRLPLRYDRGDAVHVHIVWPEACVGHARERAIGALPEAGDLSALDRHLRPRVLEPDALALRDEVDPVPHRGPVEREPEAAHAHVVQPEAVCEDPPSHVQPGQLLHLVSKGALLQHARVVQHHARALGVAREPPPGP
eukprot:4999156-Pleurochrysis_carterae.AAC.2